MAANKSSEPTRSTSQIEADLDATRQRLTSAVETLIDQVHPNRIKQREVARLKLLLATQLEKAKSQVFNARGDLRRDRLYGAAGALVGLITFVAILRRIRRRKA